MKKVLLVAIFGSAFLLSGCAQKCDLYSQNTISVEDKFLQKTCPEGVETLVYLESCNGCGFAVTQRKNSNCKAGE